MTTKSVRYNPNSLESTMEAAVAMAEDHPLYVFSATQGPGLFVIERMPPFKRTAVKVLPNGSKEPVFFD